MASGWGDFEDERGGWALFQEPGTQQKAQPVADVVGGVYVACEALKGRSSSCSYAVRVPYLAKDMQPWPRSDPGEHRIRVLGKPGKEGYAPALMQVMLLELPAKDGLARVVSLDGVRHDIGTDGRRVPLAEAFVSVGRGRYAPLEAILHGERPAAYRVQAATPPCTWCGHVQRTGKA